MAAKIKKKLGNVVIFQYCGTKEGAGTFGITALVLLLFIVFCE